MSSINQFGGANQKIVAPQPGDAPLSKKETQTKYKKIRKEKEPIGPEQETDYYMRQLKKEKIAKTEEVANRHVEKIKEATKRSKRSEEKTKEAQEESA